MRLINNQFRSHCVIRQLLLWNKNFGLNLLLSNCIILYRLIRLNNKRDGKLTLRKILFLLRKCGKPLNNLTRHFWHFFSTLLDIKQANGHVHAVISFLLYFIKKKYERNNVPLEYDSMPNIGTYHVYYIIHTLTNKCLKIQINLLLYTRAWCISNKKKEK